MPRTRRGRPAAAATKVAPELPRHWSEAKNEAEEAAWWDANSERLFLLAARRGKIKRATLEQIAAEMKAAKVKAEKPYPISLRIPSGDLEMAKEQAHKKGMGYQTYLKSLLHQALVAAAD